MQDAEPACMHQAAFLSRRVLPQYPSPLYEARGRPCPALREASHIAPRPPPSHTVRRHVTSATSSPPRRGRKAAVVMLDGRPSSIFRRT